MRVALTVLALTALAGCAIDREGRLRGDAGPGRRDGCTPAAETCNEADDDCDGRIDEAFDLQADLANCGRCANVCTGDPPSGAPSCVSGTCAVRCDPSFGDCDGVPANGCETSLSDPVHCGACGVACTGSTPLCDGTACVARCEAGRTQCGMSCVDVTSDPSHCGSCDNACAAGAHQSASCLDRLCVTVCDATFGDCDGSTGNGCEQPLDDVMHCGACGMRCDFDGASAETCPGGVCRIGPCNPGLGDCDLVESTGCETSLNTDTNCGGCGVACMEPTPVCGTDAMGATACISGCSPAETRCGSSCVITDTDPSHCGGCDMPCGTPPGTSSTSCAGGTCSLTCMPGFGDCNGTYADGCEERLDTNMSCVTCGTPCAPPDATGSCASGTCTITRCDTGFYDCNRMVADGCESPMPCPCSDCAGGCALGCCERTCADNSDCATTCATTCSCRVDCVNHNRVCDLTCTAGSRCDLDCTNGDDCSVICAAGASCSIDCSSVTGASRSCDMDCQVPGIRRDCPGEIITCNREC